MTMFAIMPILRPLTPAKAETPTVKPTETNQAKPETTGAEKLPASGTYNVTRSLNVKN